MPSFDLDFLGWINMHVIFHIPYCKISSDLLESYASCDKNIPEKAMEL